MTTAETQASRLLMASLGEVKIAKGRSGDVLACLGLGSCVAVCLHDARALVGGIAHVVLPADNGRRKAPPATFADTGLPYLLDAVEREGAVASRLTAKIVGGARIVNLAAFNDVFEVGARNIQAVQKMLDTMHIPIVAVEVGGTKGRSVRFYVASGLVVVSTAAGIVREM